MLINLQNLREEREEGFTLIELLVVILIIGILSAIAIPAFLNQRKSAVDSSVQSDISNAAKQVETMLIKMPDATVVDADTVNNVTTLTLKKNGAGTVANGGALTTTINVSKGTVIRGITPTPSSYFAGSPRDPNGYVLTATNTGGDIASSGTGFIYKSNMGGLQK